MAPNITWKMFNRYVDNRNARFQNKAQSLKFLDILNNEDPVAQYTIEIKSENKHFHMLDITIKTNDNSSCNLLVIPSLMFKLIF